MAWATRSRSKLVEAAPGHRRPALRPGGRLGRQPRPRHVAGKPGKAGQKGPFQGKKALKFQRFRLSRLTGRGPLRHYPRPRSASFWSSPWPNRPPPRFASTAKAARGFFYVTKKNTRTMTEKFSIKKYDPVLRKHVEFKEGKIK